MILDEPAVRAIADLLGSEVHKAPFEVPKLDRGHEGQPATAPGPVFQVSIRKPGAGRAAADHPLAIPESRRRAPWSVLLDPAGNNVSGALPWSGGAFPPRRPVGVPVCLSQGTCRPGRIGRLGQDVEQVTQGITEATSPEFLRMSLTNNHPHLRAGGRRKEP